MIARNAVTEGVEAVEAIVVTGRRRMAVTVVMAVAVVVVGVDATTRHILTRAWALFLFAPFLYTVTRV